MESWIAARRSRRRATRILVVLALVLVAALAGADELSGRVVGVTDGDTIKVLHNGHPEVVRLRGIDAPEKRQPYGTRAKELVASLTLGKTVTVHTTGRDRYGRLLGEVVLPDGRILNRELVRAGYAWWFRRYSADPTLARLETEAREARRGLWADRHSIPPWEFRRGHGLARAGS